MTGFFAILALAGLVGVLLQELRYRSARAKLEELEKLPRVLEEKRKEYRRALEEIASCADPGDLATRLLDDPWLGDHPASPEVDPG